MSQAERESSESAEQRAIGPFMVRPEWDTEELQDEADQRLNIVRGFLNLLACGKCVEDGFFEDLESVARGSVKLLDEARALGDEYSRRIAERDRPRREAAERRQKRARNVRLLAEMAVHAGKDKATALRLAKEAAADLEKAKGATGEVQ